MRGAQSDPSILESRHPEAWTCTGALQLMQPDAALPPAAAARKGTPSVGSRARKSQQARDQRARKQAGPRYRGAAVQWPQQPARRLPGFASRAVWRGCSAHAAAAGGSRELRRRQGRSARLPGVPRGVPRAAALPGCCDNRARGLARAPLALLVGAGLRSSVRHHRPCRTLEPLCLGPLGLLTQRDCPSVLCQVCRRA